MPRTPKATDGETPKKRTRKVATEAANVTKVTKAPEAAQTTKPEAVAVPAAVVEIPAAAKGGSRLSQTPSEERIRIRAYELYLRRGGVGGSPEQDWFQAVSEIYSESVA